MLSVILYALLAWFLYNLVFRFIIPIYKASRQMKKGFREVQARMQEQMRRQEQANAASQATTEKKPAPSAPAGDYIDFEEVK